MQPNIVEGCLHELESERMIGAPAESSDYKLRVERAISHLERNQVILEDDASLDAGAVIFMIEQFFRCAEVQGEKRLAGWLTVFPDYNLHDSVLLDTAFLKWVGQALESLKEGPADSPLWDVDYPELLVMLVRAAKELRIKAVPYQLRHAGLSWDRVRQLRSAVAFRKQGRKHHQQSRARHEKHARVAAEHQRYTAVQVDHFDTCARQLEAQLRGGDASPAAPLL